MPEDDTQLQLSLPVELHRELEAAAARANVPVEVAIERILEHFGTTGQLEVICRKE